VDALDLTDEEWRWMEYAAKQAGILYAEMYNSAVRLAGNQESKAA